MLLSRDEDAYEMTDIEAAGDTVSFGHVIYHKSGRCFAGSDHSLVIAGGKIVRWDWGTPQACP